MNEFTDMRKGDRIPRKRVERIVEAEFGSNEFALKSHQLADRIENDLKRSGYDAVVATQKGDVVVLTDAEATVYTDEQCEAGWRKLKKNSRRKAIINPDNLNREQRERHERSRYIQGQMLAGAETAKRAARRERLMGRA